MQETNGLQSTQQRANKAEKGPAVFKDMILLAVDDPIAYEEAM